MSNIGNEIALTGTGAIRVPEVVLSERAFEHAQEAGFTDIAPNRDGMLTICQVAGVEAGYVPDITVVRDGGGSMFGGWEKNYNDKDMPDDFRYMASYDLGVQERDPQYVTRRSLGEYQVRAAKTIVQLTVKDWEGAAEEMAAELAWQMKEAENLAAGAPTQGGSLALDAVSWFARQFGDKTLSSPRQKAVEAARKGVRPYIFTPVK